MVKYYQIGDKYVIEDYLSAKKFSSFLPSIAGIDGKPLWAFYANVGQCMGGFGVNNKENPLTPFDSAFLAYTNIPLKGFRTFIDINGQLFEPFSKPNNQKLIIERSQITIIEETDLFTIEIKYSTVSHQPYPALIRKVRLVNKSQKNSIKLVDGLPIFLPLGVSNYEIHELTTLVAAYTEVSIKENYSWFRYTNRGGDNSQVVLKEDGSSYFSIDSKNKPLKQIVDVDILFSDPAFRNIYPLDVISSKLSKQVLRNKIFGAFSYVEKALNNNEEIEFISLFGSFDNEQALEDIRNNLSFKSLDKQFDETKELVDSLLPHIKTSDERLDEYIKQSFFDNGLRGGFPTIINDKPIYLYSKKHGDMERDYNSFEIPSTYFSSGYGNFRDINQNRRNDLLLEPKIGRWNIYLFFSLIEANGFNPLLVDTKLLNEGFSSFDAANDYLKNIDLKDVRAKYVEGYWIDHWVYNIDLLENYISVYPDKVEELLNEKIYRFFDSGIRIKPRKERYVVTEQGIRQYNSLEKINEQTSCWLLNDENEPVTVNLASKIFDLILKKFVTLDPNQIGLEMIADKPGWNDSLNGLPGLLGSSVNESIELLRLTELLQENLQKTTDISLTEASYNLFKSVLQETTVGLIYWDFINLYRETFELEYRTKTNLVSIDNQIVNLFLNRVTRVLNDGLVAAKGMSRNGIIPTYFVNEICRYHLDPDVVVDEFITKPLPAFLEGPARLSKLGIKYFDDAYAKRIENSNLFDKKLKVFKMSESLDDTSKEIGRITMFSPGWLERESDFLHMSYKYLLGLLINGNYSDFFKLAKTNIPCFMDPKVYGRPTNENVSFIVSNMHPNKDIVGQGYYARLTGANTEIINMYQLVLFGKQLFEYDKDKLKLCFKPHIPLSLFKDGIVEASLFKTIIVYHNENNKDYDEQTSLKYVHKSLKQEEIPLALRDGKIDRLDIFIK